MKSSTKPAHRSNWKNIVVFDTREIKVFNLTFSGGLAIPFIRNKPKHMDELYQTFDCKPRSAYQMKASKNIKFYFDQEIDLILRLSDHFSSIMDSFDPTYSLEFFELNLKQ